MDVIGSTCSKCLQSAYVSLLPFPLTIQLTEAAQLKYLANTSSQPYFPPVGNPVGHSASSFLTTDCLAVATATGTCHSTEESHEVVTDVGALVSGSYRLWCA
jgi:hypothetical protein